MMRINTAIPKNVAPSGFPIWRSLVAFVGCGFMPSRSDNVAFSRNSWVIAIPIEAKAREVRSQARKVRSYTRPICQRPERFRKQEMWECTKSKMISRHTSFIIQFYASIFIYKIMPPSFRLIVFVLPTLLRRSPTGTPSWNKVFVFWCLSCFISIPFHRCGSVESLASPFPPRKWRDLICWAFGRMLFEGWKMIMGSRFGRLRHVKLHTAISSRLRGGRLKVLGRVWFERGCRWGSHFRSVRVHAVSTALVRLFDISSEVLLLMGGNVIKWGISAHDWSIFFLASWKVGRLQRVFHFAWIVISCSVH